MFSRGLLVTLLLCLFGAASGFSGPAFATATPQEQSENTATPAPENSSPAASPEGQQPNDAAGDAVDDATLHYEEYPTIRLRSLDKITARTLTFDAQVGTVIKFGDIYIKILSCRKPPAVEKTESAAFLQIWQVDKDEAQSRWIFSGWMFGSSPALSAMDHPVYDVWVIDCLGKDPEEEAPPADAPTDQPLPDEGEVSADEAQEPDSAPEDQRKPDSFNHMIDNLTGESPASPESSDSAIPEEEAPPSADDQPEDAAPEPQKSEPEPEPAPEAAPDSQTPQTGDSLNGIY